MVGFGGGGGDDYGCAVLAVVLVVRVMINEGQGYLD